MSAWLRCGQPSCWQVPVFQSMLRGTSGQRVMPRRSGFTACQTSMNGCPTTSTCLPTGERAMPCAIRLSLEPLTRWSTSTPDPALRARPEVAQVVGEVVDTAEELHDHALDAQVVAPDLLDQLGVVPALDEDPAGPGDPGLGAVHGDRAGRRAGRLRRAPRRGPGGSGPPAGPRAGSPGRAGRYAACRGGPPGSACRGRGRPRRSRRTSRS